jgi:hypothetical protein
MSEHAQQRHPHPGPEDDGSPDRPVGRPGQVRGRRQALDGHAAPQTGGPSAPGDDSGVTGDEPRDEDEFDLIGDDDLGIADLGPLAPGTVDPDADSGRMRKVTQAEQRQLHYGEA